MRVLGVDYGRRRIGLAVSDAAGLLARPWQTLAAGAGPRQSAEVVRRILGAADEVAREVTTIVVGLPRRLNGDETELTADVRAFAALLAETTALPVVLVDERLSSHEAESRLAELEPDWRARKARLDAAAAAVILQDYLDSKPALGPDGASETPEMR